MKLHVFNGEAFKSYNSGICFPLSLSLPRNSHSSIFNIDQFQAQVLSQAPCPLDPILFGNSISFIAFVPVKHQTHSLGLDLLLPLGKDRPGLSGCSFKDTGSGC